MTDRLLAFVTEPDGAPDGGADSVTVVLSPWWTAGPDPRPGVVGIRTIAGEVLADLNLVDASTRLLDRWASDAGIAELFLLDGIGWWDRVRMALRWDMYELVLWRHVLARLGGPERWDRVIAPADRPHLVEACRAVGLGGRLELTGSIDGPSPATVDAPDTGETAALPDAAASAPAAAVPADVAPVASRHRGAGWRSAQFVRNVVLRLLRRPIPPPPLLSYPERLVALDRRVRAHARRRPVLVVAWAGAYQVIGDGPAARKADPFLDPAVRALRRRRRQSVTLAVQGLGLRRTAEWRKVEADPDTFPQLYVTERWPGTDADLHDDGLEARIRERGGVPLEVDGADLAPALAGLTAGYAGDWLVERRALARSVGRFLDVLRPRVVLLDREGTRLSWIAPARERGIPVVSTQHGMIYPGNPEYFRPATAGFARPDVTCVFGSWERDLLLGSAAYAPDEVVVTGSPRVGRLALPAPSAEARRIVRHELGVRDGDRMLVVSAAHNPTGELLTAGMLATALDGPLPGVHIVVKVHPQDAEPAPFDAFLAALAASGRYPAPSVTVVRDVDLDRLLAAADAHLGSASTMLTDAVVAGLPNMVVLSHAGADPLGYAAAGVAIPVRSVDDVRAFMADPRPPEPAARLAFLERHFLVGDATARLVGTVIAAADAAAARGRAGG